MNAHTDAGVPALREPPHSLEAEQSVLGALLLDSSAWAHIGDALEARDFYVYAHRLAFQAIADLVGEGSPVDVVTVHEALRARHEDVEIGGLKYLNALAQSVPTAGHVRRYAQVVREHARHRALIAAADEALALAWADVPGQALPARLDAVLAAYDGVASTGSDGPREFGALACDVLDAVQALQAADRPPGWPTGVPQLDALLNGGIRPGHLYVLAARPAVGKSSFGAWLALKLARDGHPALVLTMEMSAHELVARGLAALGAVDSRGLVTGRLPPEDWSGLAAAVDDAQRLQLHVDDEAGLTLPAITAKARRVRGLQVLLVDYLQLASGSDSRATRNDQLERVTRGLKLFAKQSGAAVLALSQLNRDVEKRGDKRPMLADLRDSGGIEQDADAVLLAWPLRASAKGHRLVGLDLAKHRQGGVGNVVLDFDPARHRWAQSTARLNDPTAGPLADDL
jgi:replicative DNA helicase